MATVTNKGTLVTTVGELPAVGTKAPDFVLTDATLTDHRLADFLGHRLVLNIVPSLETSVCAASARRFDELAGEHPDTAFVTVSADLPLAQKRVCEAQGVSRVKTLSMMRDKAFGRDYGVLMSDGPLAGILARAVVVLDEEGVVVHNELVPEIAQEPDYEAAVRALG